MTREIDTQRGPTRVVFGAGASERAREAIAELGCTRVVVIGTPGRKSALDVVARDVGAVGVLAIAKEHVPVAVAEEARREVARLGADAVLAIGGGSAIGLAKAVALVCDVRVIVVPTTYSGSEMTSIWGLSEGGVKKTGRDPRVRASLVLYDPRATLRLPRDVTIASAWNAMAHAVEALWAPDVTPALAADAEAALSLFRRALPRLLARLEDPEARALALEGAYLAGAALAETTMGLHHKICHVLGGRGLPHAETHAALLPFVVALNRDAAPDAAARIGDLFALAEATGAPSGLGALGLAHDAIGDVVRDVLAAKAPNPRPVDERELRALLEAAWKGRETMAQATEETLQGFGAAMESEALKGALPRTQNAPRRAPYGLYPELVNGVPFTTRRVDNTRCWTYRIRPSSAHTPFVRMPTSRFTHDYDVVTPNRIRWQPLEIPAQVVDFVDGMITLGGLGDPASGPGYAVHLYSASADMGDRAFLDADGDLLIVPQEGALVARTECGVLNVAPGEILLVPRGIRFTIDRARGERGIRGYVAEVFGTRFKLPERGLIGSNGLADTRHFRAPVAAYEDRACPGYRLVHKIGGALWTATQDHSPYDVVAWHGNHVPYKYDLMLFNAMGSVTWDHPDPSIHTVLTAPLDDQGRAVCDFVCFRGRWDVLEHSFRPPFAHRNAASEVNGVVRAASSEHGYVPGCTFLTPLLTSHGVSTATYEAVFAQSDEDADRPRRSPDASLWIMFESALPFRLSAWAAAAEHQDAGFDALFRDPVRHFDPTRP